MKERRLTITYAYGPNNEKPYPLIRLQGKWLERLGFAIGSRVVVATGEGVVVIVPAEEGEKGD